MEGIQLFGAPSMNLKPGSKRCAQNHRHQRQRDQEPAQREEIRDPADGVLILLGNKQENERAHQRREENDG